MRRKAKWKLVGLLLLGGCGSRDPNQTKLQYMPDMADTPIVKPHRDYLDPPEGSVLYKATFRGNNREEAAEMLKNPLLRGSSEVKEAHLSVGAHLYNQVCSPCHGVEAKGDGPITDLFPKPPDITTGDYAARPDGFFYHTITHGVGVMPYQGDKLDDEERWQVVMHLRKLQGK